MSEGAPLKVLSVLQPFRPAFSGEGEWWLRVIPRLRARGIDVEILTRSAGNLPEEELVEGTRVHRVRIDESRPYRSWMRGLLRALSERRKQFPVVLFHSPNDDAVYASSIGGRLLGWKTVFKMTLLGADDLRTIRRGGKLGAIRLAALRFADGYIAMSPLQMRGFEASRFLRGKTLVAPQGVDTEVFRPPSAREAREAKRHLGIPPGARTALFCGALVRRKGVDVLVEAWSSVRREVGYARLLLVGPNHLGGLDEPEYRRFSEGIARRIQELGLGESIHLPGYQRDMVPFYRAADVFVFPSRTEGWGSVITEAMACGLPCIVSRLDGLAEEHLTSGCEGYVIDDHHPGRWAESLVGLLRDPREAAEMGRRARLRALDRFGVDRVADRYASFLRSVAGLLPSPRPRSVVEEKLARVG